MLLARRWPRAPSRAAARMTARAAVDRTAATPARRRGVAARRRSRRAPRGRSLQRAARVRAAARAGRGLRLAARRVACAAPLAVRLRALMPRGRFESGPGSPRAAQRRRQLPGRLPAVVVGAHYDVEAAPRGFVGANDGAAGTAAVVTLARAFARAPRAAQRPRAALRALRRRGGAGRLRDFLECGLRGSTAYAVRHAGETRGARAAGLHRREARACASRARRGRTRAVDGAARRGTHGGRGRAVLRRGVRARSSTTTRRSRARRSARST